ncbi:MAG: hypothetical protein F4052_06855 [Dehalococcoidia bacterium]|nr:hypothetical protein [Dehalococcoidia bacterium]MYK26650.1 hypothetical protein [Dehalococcoidia bacterium]
MLLQRLDLVILVGLLAAVLILNEIRLGDLHRAGEFILIWLYIGGLVAAVIVTVELRRPWRSPEWRTVGTQLGLITTIAVVLIAVMEFSAAYEPDLYQWGPYEPPGEYF